MKWWIKALIITAFVFGIIMGINLASAFTPQDNINLRNVYNITNTWAISGWNWIEGANFTGNTDYHQNNITDVDTLWVDKINVGEVNATLFSGNLSGTTVNASYYWVTSEGILSNVVDILGSWITNNLNWVNISQVNSSLGDWKNDKSKYYNSTQVLALNGTWDASTLDGQDPSYYLDDTDTNTEKAGAGYLYNDSDYIYLNDTKLNATIDERDSDTTYSAGTNLTLTGTTFALNTSAVTEWLNNVYAVIGSVFSGSWNDLTNVPAGFSDNVDNDTKYTHLSNFTDDSINNTGLVINWSEAISFSDTDTHVVASGEYLYNDTEYIYFNETKLNQTIDARDDTGEGGKSGSGYLYNDTTTIYLNETLLNATIDARDSDTSYSHLSNFTDDLGNRGYTSLSNFTDNIGVSADWDNVSDVPTATPASGLTTFLSTAGQIYSWVISLGYITALEDDATPQLGGYLDTDGFNIGSTSDEIEDIFLGDGRQICFGDDQDSCIRHDGVDAITIDGFVNFQAGTNMSFNDTGNITIIDLNTTAVREWLDGVYATGSPGKEGDGIYLYNDTTILYLNETKLNLTIDDRDSDTTYTAGSNLSLGGTTFSLDTAGVKAWLDGIYASIGSVFSGSWNDLADMPSGFSDDVDNDTTYSHLSNFTNDEGFTTNASALAYVNSTGLIINWSGSGSGENNILTDNLYNTTELEEQGDGKLGIINSWLTSFIGSVSKWDNYFTKSESWDNVSSSEWITPSQVLDIDDADIESDLNTYVDIAGDTMTGSLDMGDQNITSVSWGEISNVWLVNLFAQGPSIFVNDEMNMGSNKITSLADPTSNQDAATKKYVDDNAVAVNGSAIIAGSTSFTANAATRYLAVGHMAAEQSTETKTQFTIPYSGTIRNLYVYTNTADGGETANYTIRLNAADSSVNCLTTASSSCNDTLNTISVSAGDKISLKQVTTGTGVGDVAWSFEVDK